MSSRRWIILAVAVVLGLLGGGLVYNYVQGIENDKNKDSVEVAVYVVTEPIIKGTFAEDAASRISLTKIPERFRPANALNDPTEIAGQVAVSDLAANQVVVTDMFASQSEVLSTFSSYLQDNQVAVTISVDQVRGVAGLLVPGDFVNIIDVNGVDATAPISAPGDAGGEAPAAEGEGVVLVRPDGAQFDPRGLRPDEIRFQPKARYLYQKVQILAIGQQRQLQPGETVATNPDGSPVVQNTGLLTLAVPAEAAQWIVSLGSEDIYLTLVAPDYQPTPLGPVEPTQLYPGERPEQLTPYGPEGQTAP